MDPYLVLDISNSFTKWSVVRHGKLGPVRRLPTPKLTLAWAKAWRRRHHGLRLVAASVVPPRTETIRRVFGNDWIEVRGDRDLGIPVDSPRKREIGADRLANAVAGRALYGAPVVIVDFGTAVTFDVVNPAGAYCGGVIAVGLPAMTDYLHEKTALLPRVTIREPRRALGKSTREAMLAGAVFGYRGLIREILAGLSRELGAVSLPVVATGGHGALVARGMPEIMAVNPLLTLEGLRMIGIHCCGHGK
jgi:type III pantothenate kinase